MLLLLQALQLVDAFLHDGDAEGGGEFRIVLPARQGPGRARIGDAHGRQALARLEPKRDVHVDLAQRQFGHRLHLDVGIGIGNREGREIHLAFLHVDGAGDGAEVQPLAAPQRIEDGGDARRILGGGERLHEGGGREAEQAEAFEIIAALPAHRGERAGGAPALALEAEVEHATAGGHGPAISQGQLPFEVERQADEAGNAAARLLRQRNELDLRGAAVVVVGEHGGSRSRRRARRNAARLRARTG